MTDVINKDKAKKLYKLFRSLSGKGLTIILLAHTNKYKDEDGSPIFEGTGDLRADVDELIYLIPHKNPDGSMTVSTLPDKIRGNFRPISFKISADRDVKLLEEFIDTKSQVQQQKKLEKDREVIEAINSAIDQGHINQKQISDHVKNSSAYGVRTIRRVLSDYSTEIAHEQGGEMNDNGRFFWGIVRGDRNEIRYKQLTLKPPAEDKQIAISTARFSGR